MIWWARTSLSRRPNSRICRAPVAVLSQFRLTISEQATGASNRKSTTGGEPATIRPAHQAFDSLVQVVPFTVPVIVPAVGSGTALGAPLPPHPAIQTDTAAEKQTTRRITASSFR